MQGSSHLVADFPAHLALRLRQLLHALNLNSDMYRTLL
jgi:hypothetical protein